MRRRLRTKETGASSRTDTPRKVPATNAELVIGLVGPVGVDLEKIGETIKGVLARFGYSAELIRLSEALKKRTRTRVSGTLVERYRVLMDAGDAFRKQYGNDAVARLAIREIVRARRQRAKKVDGGVPPVRAVYVIRSLKTPEEVELLRGVYGSAFLLVSVGASERRRSERLSDRLRSELRRKPSQAELEDVRGLILRDESDSSRRFGQNVRDAFPLADLFVDLGRGVDSAREEMERFLKLVLGFQFCSPTRDEWGMFLARAAAVRSLELGRQVGAAVLNRGGQVLATGCNELPRAGGGLVWTEDLHGADDPRDWKRGADTNRTHTLENIVELVDRLRQGGLLVDGVATDVRALLDLVEPLLKGSRSLALTEFGRAVHAEMAAIVDAARLGVGIQGGHLYTTTFPCHNCARHIIAAGLERVVFVEPYPKSLASTFHNDAIMFGEHEKRDSGFNGLVRFEPFRGIAPRVYLQVFESKERKNADGTVIQWRPSESRPRTAFAAPHISYLNRETLILEEFGE